LPQNENDLFQNADIFIGYLHTEASSPRFPQTILCMLFDWSHGASYTPIFPASAAK